MKFSNCYNPASEFFSSMKNSDLREFYDDFMLNLPYCIEELMQMIHSTSEFSGWVADFSAESLSGLGSWLERTATKRDFTEKEIDALGGRFSNDDGTSFLDLSEETKTAAIYAGMYYGQVALKNNTRLRWELQLGSRRLADYGQPVIVGSRAVPLNPVRVVNSFCRGILSGDKVGGELKEMYEYWASIAQSDV